MLPLDVLLVRDEAALARREACRRWSCSLRVCKHCDSLLPGLQLGCVVSMRTILLLMALSLPFTLRSSKYSYRTLPVAAVAQSQRTAEPSPLPCCAPSAYPCSLSCFAPRTS